MCAWHPKYFPAEPVPLLREVSDGTDHTSHGVCPACRSILSRPGMNRTGPQPSKAKVRDPFTAPPYSPTPSKSMERLLRRQAGVTPTHRSNQRSSLRKNLIGKFVVQLYGGERLEMLVHRQGHEILLNHHPMRPDNQISELGWRREILFQIPNIVDLEFHPADPASYGLGFRPGLNPLAQSPHPVDG